LRLENYPHTGYSFYREILLASPTEEKDMDMPRTLTPVTTDTDADTVYMSANRLRINLRITDRQLATALARGRVRVLNNVGLFPVYSVEDMKAYMRDLRNGQRTKDTPPVALARKRKTATK
jgi:hypothetical protein